VDRTIQFEIEEPTLADVDYLEDRLYEFNSGTTGIGDGRLLAVFVRDEDGGLIAGATGHTWGEACELRQVWVSPALRGHGVGRRLMAEAEAEAVRRGARQVVLTTHSFQAPEFYRKLGFEVIAEIPDVPRGHSHLTLRKWLPRGRRDLPDTRLGISPDASLSSSASPLPSRTPPAMSRSPLDRYPEWSMPSDTTSAKPAFVLAGISILLAVATGLAWVGQPLRLVQLITLLGLGMMAGVSWLQAVMRVRQRRGE